MSLAGHATPEGTRQYAERFRATLSAGHFRQRQQLSLSSVGLGTYLGDPDDATDALYLQAIIRAVELGCNVIDTAINYRCQRSERVIGKAIGILTREKGFRREEIFVASKAGFIPFDGDFPAAPQEYFFSTYVSAGILQGKDIVAGCHAMTPAYLSDQLDRSRRNLGLDTIDLYYLHNPETQLTELPRKAFLQKVRQCFEFFEKCVAEGKIRRYGTATWNGYRVSPQEAEYLSVEEMLLVAKDVAGTGHHFRAVQLPYNLAMPEAFGSPNQQVGAGFVPALEACERYELTAMASAAILQGQLSSKMPQKVMDLFTGCETPAQCAIQFVRSTPGIASALVGMKSVRHVEENMGVARRDPLTKENFMKLFTPVS